jgi:N-acetyl-gamma-glutamyl-phosphate reductase
MARTRVALVGATGYTGAELLRLLSSHPHVEVTVAVARKEVGKPLAELYPHLTGRTNLVLEPFDADAVAAKADVAFLALPHGTAAATAKPLLDRGMTVLDLSADFRLRDRAVYEAHYGTHPHPELLDVAVYGLVEHHRERLSGRKLVAVPGCYPTAVALAAAPLLRAGLVSPDRLLASCLSGVSGAGREAKVGSLFCEAGEGAAAYGVAVHRHQPEMEQELSLAAGRPVTLTFVPHLVPMSRGIHASVALDLLPGRTAEEVDAAFRQAYEGAAFVQWLGLGKHPSTAWVRASNRALVGAAVDARLGRVVVTSVIDNLVKGASGQAIQCLNAVLGMPETAGLEGGAVFP